MQVSAGEEGIMVGSSAALDAGDVITCQYRETGVFLQRGFTLKDFMSQLFSNKNDPGKGRNMPVHYSGKKKTNVVSPHSTMPRFWKIYPPKSPKNGNAGIGNWLRNLFSESEIG